MAEKRPLWTDDKDFQISLGEQEPPLKPAEIRWLARMANKKPKEKKNEVSRSARSH